MLHGTCNYILSMFIAIERLEVVLSLLSPVYCQQGYPAVLRPLFFNIFLMKVCRPKPKLILTTMSVYLPTDVFLVQELSSMFLQVKTTFGLRLQYSWKDFRLYLQADERWKDDTVGLCGTFNGNIQDDFL